MGLGARFMKRKTVSRSLLSVLVALAVIAFAIPVLANPTPYSTSYSVSRSFANPNLGASVFSVWLHHDKDDKWGKCGDKWNPCAVPEEPSLVQMGLLLALFAVVIPKAVLARRKA